MANREWIEAAAAMMAQYTGQETVLVGFDGFVDEIIHLVDERLDRDHYKRMETIAQFGARVNAAAGFSTNIEMVSQQVKLGGNGPIMADALRAMGCGVNYVGALGEEAIHPVFAEFADACLSVISLAEPAHTDALEFTDGKLMMGKMASLKDVNWDTFQARISDEELVTLLESLDLVGCVNWTMVPNMNSILEGLIPFMAKLPRRLKVFIDLTDPRKRTREDIRAVLDVLARMQEHAEVILGMNEQESVQVEEVLTGQSSDSVEERAAHIREQLGLYLAVVHPVRSACVAWAGGQVSIDGPYTQTPRLTTGAGDVFNAGFCRGLLAGLTPQNALVSGVCASGFYVRNARPASHQELTDFMTAWAKADGGSI